MENVRRFFNFIFVVCPVSRLVAGHTSWEKKPFFAVERFVRLIWSYCILVVCFSIILTLIVSSCDTRIITVRLPTLSDNMVRVVASMIFCCKIPAEIGKISAWNLIKKRSLLSQFCELVTRIYQGRILEVIWGISPSSLRLWIWLVVLCRGNTGCTATLHTQNIAEVILDSAPKVRNRSASNTEWISKIRYTRIIDMPVSQ